MIDSPTRRVAAQFEDRFDGVPSLVARAPGRVNLLGAHVDYHEGWVLPGAIDRGLELAAAPRADRRLRLAALDLDRWIDVDLDALPAPRVARPERRSEWFDVPVATAWACRQRGLEPCGLDVAFGGDLPIGAGVSSSAAVEVGLLLLWDRLGAWGLDRPTLAGIGREAENGYLDVGGGIMDQYASLHGRPGHLLLLDCRTVTHRELPLGDDLAVLVLDSGVRRRLADTGYNERRDDCRRALEILRASGLELATLRDLPAAGLDAACSLLPATLARRVRHVVEECARVTRAGELLTAGRAAEVGPLMCASHASSRDLYEVSIAELDLLAESAAAAPGCHGARLTGAGFGGCVTALVDATAADEVAAVVGERFAAVHDRRPPAFICRIAGGAEVRPWV
jgi:galactokinase